MIFSLIVPTIRRTEELSRLLASIAGQKLESLRLTDIEVIVVDQNPDDRLVPVLKPYWGRFSIVHLKAPPLGQSHAKNIGMKSLRGRYVGFPDDDCFFAEDSLETVHRVFQETGDRSALFGRGMEKESGKFLLDYPASGREIRGPKDPSVFLGLQIAQFYTEGMVRAVGDFDVDLCSGGKWGSGEETDFAIRCLRQGTPIWFRPEILVYHPLVVSDTMDPSKLRRYSLGFGALCRKQGLLGLIFWKTAKQLAGFFLYSLTFRFKKAAACWIIATSRLQGYLLIPGKKQ